MQCRWLAISVKTFDSEEKPFIKEAGKLVITKPIPSMPIYFWEMKTISGIRRVTLAYSLMYGGTEIG
ncbi:hypothetical protein [Acidianus ambivalens]|uniref:Uncharacterized protein n=1 Tax=Acidianus ambivalens TaxID=2283 RepID=A0A650CWA8_ACIAM|nr:hypothetical protein [Acidianus ambivalens]MQL54293.1 hypothetical protein [Acidianus ambivalens]QGR22120.1 hypothetical protein D1866_09110 [Acidianus ambivalens]